MAKRVGKCTNFGLCRTADSRRSIDVGEGGEFSCPECGKPLREAAAAGPTAPAKSGGGKKVAVVGALALILSAGAAYKFLGGDGKTVVKHDGPNDGVQTVPGSTTPSGPTPVTTTPPPSTPPPSVAVVTPPPVRIPPTRPPVKHVAVVTMPPTPPPPTESVTTEPPPAPKHDESVETPAPKSETSPSSGTMVARLLSPINTKTAAVGDQFTAIIEEGPHKGAILTGTVKKLGKSKKNNEIELDFISLTKDNQKIAVNLELVDISNSQKMKGVDDEGHIVGKSSKKKGIIGGIVGAVVGGVVGKKEGGNKGMVAGLVAGGAGGYLLTAKLTSSAQDLELEPGALMTLRVADR
jgi:hypothetical protein